MSQSFLELKNLKKSFTPEEYVLQGINLKIEQGEFVTLLDRPAAERRPRLASWQDWSSRIVGGEFGRAGCDDIGTPQKGCEHGVSELRLFPHMDVEDNIAYGLRSERCQSRRSNRK